MRLYFFFNFRTESRFHKVWRTECSHEKNCRTIFRPSMFFLDQRIAEDSDLNPIAQRERIIYGGDMASDKLTSKNCSLDSLLTFEFEPLQRRLENKGFSKIEARGLFDDLKRFL